jgi:hypothetical protein
MKTKIPLSILFSFSFYLLSSQVPQGFNYQAIARDGSGNPITNATISVKLSILTDTSGFYQNGTGTYIWEEEQTGIKTNAFGLFTVVFGDPSATKKQGSAGSFSSIDWSVSPLYIGTKIDNSNGYKNLGSAKLWSVPYSMIASKANLATNATNASYATTAGSATSATNANYATTAGSATTAANATEASHALIADSAKGILRGSKLTVRESVAGTSDALFEVKRKDGQTVFAVYPDAVNIYIPQTAKGSKGGFAIGGLDGSKATPQDYFRVTKDSVRFYIDQTPVVGKGATKGGFAIGGFDQTKGVVQDLLTVSKDSVRIYIDKTPVVKGTTKGGFAIGGFDQVKGNIQDLLTVSNDSIRMYINDLSGKGTTKGGFAIGGFSSEKGAKKFLNIETDTTGKVNPSVNRILWYPIKNAFLTGRVLIEDHDSVGVNSFSSGFETKAIGNYSQALGYSSIASGNYSTSIGYRNLSSGSYSFTMGYGNTASGVNSNAFGINSVAIGLNSFAMGYNARALGSYAYVMGFNSASMGGPSFAFGDRCQALKWGSVAMGWLTKSDATHSMTIGDHTISKAQNLFVIGRANDTTVFHTDSWDGFYDEDPVFIIGNGWVYNNVAQTRNNAFTVLKSGKTSINLNYPTYMLDVNGEIASRNTEALRFRNNDYSTLVHQDGTDIYLLVTDSGNPDGTWNSFRPFRLNYSTGDVFMGSNNNGTNFSLTVKSDGKVGIGTTTPNGLLSLGTSAGRKLFIYDDGGGANEIAGGMGIDLGGYSGETNIFFGNFAGNGRFSIGAWTSSQTFSTKMTVMANGNVGIGTDSPQANLEVLTSGINRLAGIAITSINTNGKQISLNQGEAGKLNITAPGIDLATFDFINNRVGIKTTSPSYDLEVIGTAGKTGGGSWSTSSDARLKDIHGLYTSGIEQIMKLRPVFFNYQVGNARNLPSNAEYIGFVAQEVREVFPEAVTEGSDGYMDFNMHPVNVAMVNALQQQQKQIESLKSENLHLRSEFQSLKEKMGQIEDLLTKSGSK